MNRAFKVLLFLATVSLLTSVLGIQPARGHLAAIEQAPGQDMLISRAYGLRGVPAVAYNYDEAEFLVVWTDTREHTIHPDVYAQIVSSEGVPRGDSILVRNEANSSLAFVDVAYDRLNKRYLVVWQDSTEHDIEGQLLDKDGGLYGTAMNVASGDASDDYATPAVAFNTSGAYVVVFRSGIAGNYDIHAKRVNADGTVVATDYVITSAVGDQIKPDVQANPGNGGDFLVVWEDLRTGTARIYGNLFANPTWVVGTPFVISAHATAARHEPALAFSPTAQEWMVVFESDAAGDSQIVGRRVSTAGAPVGNNMGICGQAGDQTEPSIAYYWLDRQYLVTWTDDRSGPESDIYGRLVKEDGTGASGMLSINTGAGTQYDSAVANSESLTTPGYLVVWNDMGPTVDWQIEGQKLDTGGLLQGHQLALSAPLGDQKNASVAYNSQDGEYLVVWQDGRGATVDVWGQRVGEDGTILNNNLPISSAAGGQVLPDVAYNLDTNQYLVVWEDLRADADIYAQRINANGTLDGDEIAVAVAGSSERHRPRVVYNPISGEFLVVYTYDTATEATNVRGCRLGFDGNPLAGEIDIATGTTDQTHPDVACRSKEGTGGGYLIVWRQTDGSQRDIKGRRMNASGSFLGYLNICDESHSQWSPRVDYSPGSDRYLVVWPDDRDAATQGRNIYGLQVSGSGAMYGETIPTTVTADQSRVAVTHRGEAGGYVLAWEDDRHAGSAPDLYAQPVGGEGGLVGSLPTNYPQFIHGGAQESPDLAWAGATGLLVWHDGRSGTSYHVYGMRVSGTMLGSTYIHLPLVQR